MALRWTRRAAAVFMAVLLVAVCCAPSLADGEEDFGENGAWVLRDDGPEIIPDDIINFKAKLFEMGFYSLGADESQLRSKELDDLTMAAVKLACELNDMPYNTSGVSWEFYWRVMGQYGEPLRTPTDVYAPLGPESSGEAVTAVQERLTELGYDAVAGPFTPGKYDGVLQSAVEAFARANELESEGGISSLFQERLFSDDAVRYASAGFFASVVVLLGLRVPLWLLTAVGVALVVAAVAVVVVVLRRKDGGRDGENIQFMVEYGGRNHVYSLPRGRKICIGRAYQQLPLDPEDQTVSREHGTICEEKGSLVFRDDSRYGTKVNGELCHHGEHILRPGDVLEVGKHQITVLFKD